jgi:hypothetical protein
MNHFLRLFTLLSAGVVLGSMAGRMVRTENLSLTRIFGIGEEEGKKMIDKDQRIFQAESDELEDYFI